MFTQTIIKIYFDYNLKNNPHKDSLKIFDFIVLAIKCGHYNFSFVSTVLNSVSYIIDEFFKDDNFKNSLNDEFFCNFTDKLVSVSFYNITLLIKKFSLYISCLPSRYMLNTFKNILMIYLLKIIY